MTPGLHTPNLSGLGLNQALVDAVRLAFQQIQTLAGEIGTGALAGAVTVVDITLTGNKTIDAPDGAAAALVCLIRQDASGGHTYAFDSRTFDATGPSSVTTANTVTAYLFVKGTAQPTASSPAKYTQVAVFSTGMATGVSNTQPRLVGNGELQLPGMTTVYNNAATHGIGTPPVYATATYANQSGTNTTSLQVGGAKAPAGLYRVSIYVNTHTAGAGNVVVAVSTNDGIGVKTFSVTLNLIAGNAGQTTILPRTDGSVDITLTATYAATGAYDLYVTMERLL